MTNNDSIDLGDSGRRIKRRGSFPITGSVWESRMKLDEVKGGIEVLIASEIHLDNKTTTMSAAKQSPIEVRSKRKTWKSQNSDDNPIQIAMQRSFEGVKVKSELIESSPVVINKLKSDDEDCGEFGVCEDKAITSNFKEMAKKVEEDDKIEAEKKSFNIKEFSVHGKVATEERRNVKTTPSSPILNKQASPVFNHARTNKIQTKTKPKPNLFNGIQRTNIKLQSFVDLIMWRDVIKSAFVFGIGSFVIIISSSYTKDLSISFISAISYLSLLYLAIIFLFRSFFNRSFINTEEEYVIEEAEAIRILRFVLPCVNEFLLNLRVLFSGDPSTTLKLAILLFILALNGSTITMWKMVKLCFFGVFTVPRFCSSYSSQLTAYGTFWIQRIGNAWDSCSHKKAIVFAIFIVFWNLSSSVVTRLWAVFMLIVAFKDQSHSLEEREGCRVQFSHQDGNKRIVGQTKSKLNIEKWKPKTKS